MNSILTNKGSYFFFDRPEEHDYLIEEIAHALSHICRFTGHTKEFYSVAQHSVLVSLLVPYEYKLEALLHDASEAYLGDVASPLKALLPQYKAIERRVEQAIARRYSLRFPLPKPVKIADGRMLVTEKRDLLTEERAIMSRDEFPVPVGYEPTHCTSPIEWPAFETAAFKVEPLAPAAAKALFLQRFFELTSQDI